MPLASNVLNPGSHRDVVNARRMFTISLGAAIIGLRVFEKPVAELLTDGCPDTAAAAGR